MRRFLTKLAESPLAQTWLVLGMLAIAFIVDEVGVWITDDRIAKVYCEVMIPFVYVLYLALFLIGLVLFVTSFLRRGWRRKLLWLFSLAVIVAIFMLLFRLDSAFHEEPVRRHTDCLAWYARNGRRLLREHWQSGLLILALLALQWFLDGGERLLRMEVFINEMLTTPRCVARKEARRKWRRATAKVLLGIVIGFAMFFFATQAWVRVDHGEDATIGPCTYYGRPLSFSMSAPGLSIMHSAAHFKCLNFVFDIIFWCGMAWLILFAPDIRRSCQERRVCSQATSGI